MATDKKHIAVYLGFAVELALIKFCEQKGLKSKKGTMFSAGVNAALEQFFGIVNTEAGNIPQEKIPMESQFEVIEASDLPKPQNSQLRKDIAALYAINTRLRKTAESNGYTPGKVVRAAVKAQASLVTTIKALEALDDIVAKDD